MQSRAPPTLIEGKWKCQKKIGAGCFGTIWAGENTETEEIVALKLEDRFSTAPQLEREADILKLLASPTLPQGFARLFYYGTEGQFNVLIMDRLGKSLEDCVQKCGGRFNVVTSALVADQIIRRIEYLHSKRIVHRDIKTENFMLGMASKSHHVYLIDFGLSKMYYGEKHAALRQKLSLTGTARYASINAHKGLEQSRRDDLEAVGHVLMYLLRGSLPWSGLDARTKEEKYRKIMEKKQQTPLNDLCDGYPDSFRNYLQYSRNLQFTERPDYDYLAKLFGEWTESKDSAYQWLEGKASGDMEPLHTPETIAQPDDPSKASEPSESFTGNLRRRLRSVADAGVEGAQSTAGYIKDTGQQAIEKARKAGGAVVEGVRSVPGKVQDAGQLAVETAHRKTLGRFLGQGSSAAEMYAGQRVQIEATLVKQQEDGSWQIKLRNGDTLCVNEANLSASGPCRNDDVRYDSIEAMSLEPFESDDELDTE